MTLQKSQTSEYLVLGKDAEGVQEDLMLLAEAHWDYIERFTSELTARGPLLSTDGRRHLGSVHILSANSLRDAEHFAQKEPYNQANLYADVMVTKFTNLLGQSMWDRPAPPMREQSTFLLTYWPDQVCATKQIDTLRARARQADSWVFVGLLVSPEGKCNGMAAASDLEPTAAEESLRALLEHSGLHSRTIKASRWRRGGRQR